MAISGTTVFDLDLVEMIEEAYERAGVEARTGYDMRTARRSLNMLFIEWANKGYNLWTIYEGTLPLVAGTSSYALAASLVDIVEFVVRDSRGRDQAVTRVPLGTHASRNDKSMRGRPNQIYVDRQRTGPIVHLWPVPDSPAYTLVYWGMRRISDGGVFTNTTDVPFRFLPAVAAGLAHKLAEKKQPSNEALIARLEGSAIRAFNEAADEDRDRSDFTVTPQVYRV